MDFTLSFGSRSGSWAALTLFGAIFAILGALITREMARRAPEAGARVRRVIGWAFFIAPVSLIWWTSLAGFYEAQVRDGNLQLRGLTGLATTLPASSITSIRARPWYRGRWRLVITAAGTDYESASWHRTEVQSAGAKLNEALRR